MYFKLVLFTLFICQLSLPVWSKTGCGSESVWLQVLGSGGPEMDDGRASSAYLIWHNGKARILVDIGGGSMFQFEQVGAMVNDLDVMVLSHLHVDHSSDLAALVKASFFSDRNRDLAIYGPSGNKFMPSLTTFLQKLFGRKGVYPYLNSYLTGFDEYQLLPYDIDVSDKTENHVLTNSVYQLSALSVHHGPLPALAWRVVINKKIIVFSGDMNNNNKTLARFANNANILIAHHAIPEGLKGIARNLHMPPSEIGKVAAKAQVKLLLLSHRMKRSLGQEKTSSKHIRQFYDGDLTFVNDLQCFKL